MLQVGLSGWGGGAEGVMERDSAEVFVGSAGGGLLVVVVSVSVVVVAFSLPFGSETGSSDGWEREAVISWGDASLAVGCIGFDGASVSDGFSIGESETAPAGCWSGASLAGAGVAA